jgi:hypothetical protein
MRRRRAEWALLDPFSAFGQGAGHARDLGDARSKVYRHQPVGHPMRGLHRRQRPRLSFVVNRSSARLETVDRGAAALCVNVLHIGGNPMNSEH